MSSSPNQNQQNPRSQKKPTPQSKRPSESAIAAPYSQTSGGVVHTKIGRSQMFALGTSAVTSAVKSDRGADFMQTPARMPDTMSKLPDTVHMESAQQDSQHGKPQLVINENFQAQSPLSSAGQRTTLLGSTTRVVESGNDYRQHPKRGDQPTMLIPNFRSISPSIFNIDLNKTTQGDKIANANLSPQNATTNPIHVSIHSRKEDSSFQQVGGNASVPLIKRVGRVNKGDKIKFGVLVQREVKPKKNVEDKEKFETPKSMYHKNKLAVGQHSDHVYKIMNQYQTYTTTKTLPTALVSKHQNIIKQFKKNFTRETETYTKHLSMSSAGSQLAPGLSTTVGGGYLSDCETFKTKMNKLANETRTNFKSSQSWVGSDGFLMGIRDVIEEHAKSVAAVNKTFKPNIHLEIDEQRKKRNLELEEKGKKIADQLNVSMHSCCTKLARFYRSMTHEQPIRQHNKPLTHLMRSNQKLILEKKRFEEDDKLKQEQEQTNKIKRKIQAFSTKRLQRDFHGGMASANRGQLEPMSPKTQQRIIEEFQKKKMSQGGRKDFDKYRKELENQIDTGMTFSHLSKKYPLKKEWAKYLVLLRKKEVDRSKKELKIQAIKDDLDQKGVTDQNAIAKEIEMFEYMEFKKRRDQTKARMGVKAEAKYYRPVDTERTLQIAPISLDMSDGYDDGPGGFKLEDFSGVETMFSKQSLEQRQMRVDRARERLREKRLQRLQQREAQERDDWHQSQIESSTDILKKNSVMAELSKSKETKFALQQAVQQEYGGAREELLVSALSQRKGSQAGIDKRVSIRESANSSFISAREVAADQNLIMSAQKRDMIRVEIAQTTGRQQKGIQQHETIKTNSQIRDYSLEDGGGIFERKTLIANLSVEDVEGGRVNEGAITQRSYEYIVRTKSNSGSQLSNGIETADGKPLLPPSAFNNKPGSVRIDPNTLVRVSESPYKDGSQEEISKDETLPEDASQTQGEQLQMPLKKINNNSQIQNQKIRPSTTENIHRIMNKQRRQIMTGQNQFGHLRSSEFTAGARLSRQANGVIEKSAGMITTVRQNQDHQSTMQQNSSERKQLMSRQMMPTTSGLITEENADGTTFKNYNQMSPQNRTGIYRSVVQLGTRQIDRMMDKGSTANKTNSGISGMRTAADGENRSEPRIPIWKELMKAKEDDQLFGHEKLPRSKIKEIRNKIRRERQRSRKRLRRGTTTDMPMYSGAHTTYNAQSQSPDRRSNMNVADRPQTVQALGKDLRSSDAFSGTMSRQPVLHNGLPQAGMISVEQLRNQNYQQMQGEMGNFHSRQIQKEYTITASDPYTTTSNNQTTIKETLTPLSAAGKSMTLMQTTQQLPPTATPARLGPLIDGNFQLSSTYQNMPLMQHANISNMNDSMCDKKSFVDFNKTRVHENAIKIRNSSHLSRIRGLRSLRRSESLYQTNLIQNINRSSLAFNEKNNIGMKNNKAAKKNYPFSLQRLKTAAELHNRGKYATAMSTSQLQKPFQDVIDDRRSIKNVFKSNTLQVDPDLKNKFSRNETWNETLNCPYYGLMSLRQTQENPINSTSKTQNILRPFTLGNQTDKYNIRKVKSAIKRRNVLREMDRKIYNLIENCQSSTKIEWKSVYDEHEEFRNTQKKKMVENPQMTVEYDDLVDLIEIAGGDPPKDMRQLIEMTKAETPQSAGQKPWQKVPKIQKLEIAQSRI